MQHTCIARRRGRHRCRAGTSSPRVGVIQGATAWATLSPTAAADPPSRPAPLSHPFYVVDRGATEERHWLRIDTGYGIDIRAVRTIGKNARPRSNQTGSGLTWSSSSSALRPHHRPRRRARRCRPPGVSLARPHRSVRATGPSPSTPTATAGATCSGTGRAPAATHLWLGHGRRHRSRRSPSPSAPPTTTCSPATSTATATTTSLWYARSSGAAVPLAQRRRRHLHEPPAHARAPAAGPSCSTPTATATTRSSGTARARCPTPCGTGRATGFVASARVGRRAPTSRSSATSTATGATTSSGTPPERRPTPCGCTARQRHRSSRASRNVNGSYLPLVGDFDGDGADDVVLVRPGAGRGHRLVRWARGRRSPPASTQ